MVLDLNIIIPKQSPSSLNLPTCSRRQIQIVTQWMVLKSISCCSSFVMTMIFSVLVWWRLQVWRSCKTSWQCVIRAWCFDISVRRVHRFRQYSHSSTWLKWAIQELWDNAQCPTLRPRCSRWRSETTIEIIELMHMAIDKINGSHRFPVLASLQDMYQSGLSLFHYCRYSQMRLIPVSRLYSAVVW